MADGKFTDFGDDENCKNYLISKFDDLLQGINNQYGKELMEELYKRLEKTIATFHEDVQMLIHQLKNAPATEVKERLSTFSGENSLPVTDNAEQPEETSTDDWSRHLFG